MTKKHIVWFAVMAVSFLLFRPNPTAAQSDPCTLSAVLSAFQTAARSGEVAVWEQRYGGSQCENRVHFGIRLMADAYDTLGTVPADGLSKPCTRDAVLASFRAAALSNETNTWLDIYKTSICPAPVTNAVNSLASAYRVLTSTTFVLEAMNEAQGWHVPQGATGKIAFKDNKLVLTTEPRGTLFVVPIPDITVDPNRFYAEVATSFAHTASDQWIGFAVGDIDGGKFHVFLYGDIWDRWGIRYQGIETNDKLNIDERTDVRIEYEVPIKIGLEANNGRFALYVNQQRLKEVATNEKGQQLGLVISNGGCCGSAGIMPVSRIIVGLEREDVLETP